MSNKTKAAATKIKNTLTTVATYAGTAGIMLLPYVAFATGGNVGSSLMKEAIKLITKVIIALGVIFVVMGVIHYASAVSEGDGPAKQKATMQIAAGVMIAVLSVVLNAMADTFANLITT